MTNKTNTCDRCGAWVNSDAPGCQNCGLSWTEGVELTKINPDEPTEYELNMEEMNNIKHTKYAIISMLEENNVNNIYDHLVGIPNSDKTTKNKNTWAQLEEGTILFINYINKIGISKVVRVCENLGIDETKIEEWTSKTAEIFALRAKVELICNISLPIKIETVSNLGIQYLKNDGTRGKVLGSRYPQQSIIMLSEEDGNILSQYIQESISPESRMMRLYEISDNLIEALGNEGMEYMDTTSDDLPTEWYYSNMVLNLIVEGRDIMNSLGIEKMKCEK